MASGYCLLQLTCADRPEAEKIARTLLQQHLIACAKFIPITSMYWWKAVIDHGDEVLLVMESREDLFSQAEKAIAKLHSYETFVLTATPVLKVSRAAKGWLDKELQAGDNEG